MRSESRSNQRGTCSSQVKKTQVNERKTKEAFFRARERKKTDRRFIPPSLYLSQLIFLPFFNLSKEWRRKKEKKRNTKVSKTDKKGKFIDLTIAESWGRVVIEPSSFRLDTFQTFIRLKITCFLPHTFNDCMYGCQSRLVPVHSTRYGRRIQRCILRLLECKFLR